MYNPLSKKEKAAVDKREQMLSKRLTLLISKIKKWDKEPCNIIKLKKEKMHQIIDWKTLFVVSEMNYMYGEMVSFLLQYFVLIVFVDIYDLP